MQCTLSAQVGASSFNVPWTELSEWRSVLGCADGLTLHNETQVLSLDLGATRRWIAFQKTINGSPFACIGYQETIGAIQRAEFIIGGRNRKVLAWIQPDNSIHIGSCPR